MERVTTVQLDIAAAPAILNSQRACEELLDAVVVVLGLTKLHSAAHHFVPQGVSCIYLLSESHIALHTWPENGTGYITLSTCGDRTITTSEIKQLLDDRQVELRALHAIKKAEQ